MSSPVSFKSQISQKADLSLLFNNNDRYSPLMVNEINISRLTFVKNQIHEKENYIFVIYMLHNYFSEL